MAIKGIMLKGKVSFQNMLANLGISDKQNTIINHEKPFKGEFVDDNDSNVLGISTI